MRLAWRTLLAVCAVSAAAVAPATASAAPIKGPEATGTACQAALGDKGVAAPTNDVSWRIAPAEQIKAFERLPPPGRHPAEMHPASWVGPSAAPWLLALSGPRNADGACWVRVRLPFRPNSAAGWVNVTEAAVQPNPWRIAVSRAKRELTLFRDGRPIRTIGAVVGKPSTPTPTGNFAVAWAVKWHPNYFLGSWVLELSAHSDILRHFGGGDGTVGIHGRGGASLLDPLGTAASHGCVRIDNSEIDWLVGTVGRNALPGTPVQIN